MCATKRSAMYMKCGHTTCFLSLLLVASSSRWQGALLRGAKWSTEDLETLGAQVVNRVQEVSGNDSEWVTSDACPRCEGKDYSDVCPDGWRFEETDGSCSAPAAYTGLCGRRIVLAGRPAVDKREIELSCAVCWPCRFATGNADGACARDWDRDCPNGYAPASIPWDSYKVTPAKCVATALYEGMCEQEVNFAGTHEKEAFSRRCATSWPCSDECEPNAPLSLCPRDWLHIGEGLCVAPDYYRHDGCQLVQSFRGWSSEKKSSYATQCNVRWGCEPVA